MRNCEPCFSYYTDVALGLEGDCSGHGLACQRLLGCTNVVDWLKACLMFGDHHISGLFVRTLSKFFTHICVMPLTLGIYLVALCKCGEKQISSDEFKIIMSDALLIIPLLCV